MKPHIKLVSDATNDRNYFRQLSNKELARHVKESTSPTELEIVLAERLNHSRGWY